MLVVCFDMQFITNFPINMIDTLLLFSEVLSKAADIIITGVNARINKTYRDFEGFIYDFWVFL